MMIPARSSRTAARLAAAAALALVLAVAVAAAPADTGIETVPLELTGHFQLRVDGELEERARIFLSRKGKPRLLLVAPSLDAPVVVAAGARRARLVDPATLEDADLAADAIALPASAIATDGDTVPVQVVRGSVHVAIGGRTLALGRSAPLLGVLSPEELLDRLPEYRRNAARYEPGPEPLRRLASVEEPTAVEVVFGSWCPHCEQVVPRLLRVIEELDNPHLTFRFHGVSRAFTEEPISRQLGVKGLPTVVLSRGAQQVGRLEGPSLDEPEAALAGILAGR